MSKCQGVKNKRYKKLHVWQKAHEFVLLMYKYTESFPKHEQFGLTSQIRRAALSISTNIVEGQASMSKRDFLNFLNMSNRSLVETEYLMEISRELGYLPKEKYAELENLQQAVGGLLNGLIRSTKNRL